MAIGARKADCHAGIFGAEQTGGELLGKGLDRSHRLAAAHGEAQSGVLGGDSGFAGSDEEDALGAGL